MRTDPITSGRLSTFGPFRARMVLWLGVVVILGMSVGCKHSKERASGTNESSAALSPQETNSQAEQIELRLQAIRESGEPVTLDELNRWLGPPPPESEKAAARWTNALSMIVRIPHNAPELPARGLPFSYKDRQYFLKLLGTNKVALERLHQASGPSPSRYPTMGTNYERRCPLEDAAADAARLLQLETMFYAEAKRTDRAVSSIKTLASLARSFEDGSAGDWQVVATFLLQTSCQTTERVLDQNQLTDEQLLELQTICRSSKIAEGLTRLTIDERCHSIFNFEHWQKRIVPSLVVAEQVKTEFAEPLPAGRVSALADVFARQRDADFLFYLDATAELVAASKLPFPQSKLARSNVVARIHEQEGLPPSQQFIYSLRDLQYLALSQPLEFACVIARLRTTECAIAIERYRLAHNQQLPADLSALTPTYLPMVPVDPFDGHPLRFKPLPQGYTVYSIGSDGHDDGGKENTSTTKAYVKGTDITFIVER